MWKVKFCVVVFFLLVFVPDADCWRRRRRRRRYTPPCSQRNCQVSSWSEWSPCTHQCGTSGKQERTRTITVVASCGGSCPFALKQNRSCNRVNCQNSGTPTALATSTLQSRKSSSTLTTTQTPSESGSTPSPFIVTATSAFPTPSSSAVNVRITPLAVTTQPPFTACGRTLRGSSGSFVSPGFPVWLYPNNLNCPWTLFIPANAFVTLQFVYFDTQSCCDFVELTDIFGQRIERLSGFRPGFNVTVRGVRTSLLTIRFTTDHFVRKRGFRALYNITFVSVASTIEPTSISSAVAVTSTSTIQVTTQPPFNACGGTLSGSSGSFVSPGYPGFYSNKLNCLWTLFIPANGVLRLQFIVFETEPFFDFVELTDIFGQTIDRLNGTRSGFTVTVRGERTTLLRIRFITDVSVTRQGFNAQYSITFAPISSLVPTSSSSAIIATPTPTMQVTTSPPSTAPISSLAPTPSSSTIIATPTPTMQVTTRPPSTGECGEDLAGTRGFLRSPNFPNNFPRNTFCTSTITVPAGFIIKLTFLSFTLEPNEQTDCTCSLGGARVFITNVASDNGAQAIMLCGQNIPSPVYSVGNVIQVRLVSLNNVFPGFKAFYVAIFSGGLNPSASSLPPVASSSVATPVTLPPDVQRALVDLLRSLVQIIQRLQALVGGSFSPAEFEDFRNKTLQILQQAESQLVNPSSSLLRNVRKIRREIPGLSNPQDLVQMLENIQRRLLA